MNSSMISDMIPTRGGEGRRQHPPAHPSATSSTADTAREEETAGRGESNPGLSGSGGILGLRNAIMNNNSVRHRSGYSRVPGAHEVGEGEAGAGPEEGEEENKMNPAGEGNWDLV